MKGIDYFRLVVGVVVGVVGLWFVFGHATETPLGVATLVLGLFILVHWVVEDCFMRVRQPYDSPADTGLQDFASSFIATSAVILGLLALFGDDPLTTTMKVGIAALVADILVGLVLVGLVLAGAEPGGRVVNGTTTTADQTAWNIIRIVFNLALWALSLGLLCIAMALLYR